MRSGEFKVCLEQARRSAEIAVGLDNPAAAALAHTLLGISLSLMGNLSEAEVELDAALEAGRGASAGRRIYFGFDHYSWVRVARITLLCLQGHPTRSRAAIKEAFRDVQGMHHPVSFAIVINSAATLLWIGDLDAAEEHLDWFISRAQSESFEPHLHVGHAFKGELAICRGEVEAGIALLQSRLERLRLTRYGLFTMRLQAVLARGLAASGRCFEALALVDATERLIEEKGYGCYMPELLRLKGSILLAMPAQHVEDAEKCFLKSLELSRAQGARGWELRAATDLAAAWAARGRAKEARTLLFPVFEKFSKEFATRDLEAAKSLLTKLGARGGSGTSNKG